jgi:hypothetical protein
LLEHEDKTLGIQVKPSEVQLMNNNEDLNYAWQSNDTSLEIIFKKDLSKHSVSVYMRLSREVGYLSVLFHPEMSETYAILYARAHHTS